MGFFWISRVWKKKFRPARKKPQCRRYVPSVKRLGERIVPAITASLSASAGVLSVLGDAANNTIVVSRDAAGTILVNGGAVTVQGGTPTLANTRLIQISGLGGNDILSLDQANGPLPGANIDGGAGNDTLTGGSGDDVLSGGAGNDTYRFDTDNALEFDTINESGGGVDTVDFSATTTRGVTIDLSNPAAQVVNDGLTLTLSAGNTIENVIGGALGNTLTGNALHNVIDGGAGDDTIDGGAGNDTLTGGAGNDLLIGGAGNDTFRFDTDLALGSDTVVENNAVIDAAGGVDTLDFSATTTRAVSIDLGAIKGTQQVVNAGLTLSLGVDTIENIIGGALGDTLTGNALNNVIDGRAGNDTIDGGAGNDILTGGSGNDILIGGAGNDRYRFDTDNALGSDTINESGGGLDTLDFSATTTRAVTIDLSKPTAQVVNAGLTLSLSAGNTIENVTGGALDDALTGNSLHNVINGGAGNDTLDGGAGTDTLNGGAGTDVGINGEVLINIP